MKKLLLTIYLAFSFCIVSNGQVVDCNDYKIVSIFDIPPSPQTPGGNYFLLLLTLTKDNPQNSSDIYANIFFIDNLGDTISIPTGPSSTTPSMASDTIPYILKLNSQNSNQDFPLEFNGKLVIEHITGLVCEINFSNIAANLSDHKYDFELDIYPNPFIDYINLESEVNIESITIIELNGRSFKVIKPNSKFVKLNLEDLHQGIYAIKTQLKNGETILRKVIKK